jgi:hypothetical protein
MITEIVKKDNINIKIVKKNNQDFKIEAYVKMRII